MVAAVVGILALSTAVKSPFTWVLLALAVCGVWLGTTVLLRERLEGRGWPQRSISYWVLPGGVALGGGLWLHLVVGDDLKWVSLAAIGVLLGVTWRLQRMQAGARSWLLIQPNLCLHLVSYAVAFGLFVTIKQLHLSPVLHLLALGITSALLVLEIFRDMQVEAWRLALYAGAVAFFMTEGAWGLTFWSIGAVTFGLVLLLIYYTVAGIAHRHLAGALTRWTAFEFIAVALVGIAMIYGSQQWIG
ncbi:MAG: hypothetical protein HW403_608 [Dehalococcoidia bacterium]|nr:hypothetical protein [Dehalococcoidia bacterium]